MLPLILRTLEKKGLVYEKPSNQSFHRTETALLKVTMTCYCYFHLNLSSRWTNLVSVVKKAEQPAAREPNVILRN